MTRTMRATAVALVALLTATAQAATAPAQTAKAPTKAAAGTSDALTTMQRIEGVLEGLATRVSPSVVSVRRFVLDDLWWESQMDARRVGGWRVVVRRDLVHERHRPLRGASGFLLSADGYILTLRRAVVDPKTGEPAPFVEVDVQAQPYNAKVVSLEPTLDLAIIKIESPDPLPFLRFGDSGKSRPGHWAISFGDPDGAERTLIPGFVANSPARECYQDDMTATYMQTSQVAPDAAFGGPIVNLRGEVIGVSTPNPSSGADSLAKGSNFAMPSNIAGAIFQAMLMRESKESPWLGISVLAMNDTLRKKLGPITGIYIDNVFDPSPASKIGIVVGDVLRAMDDKPIATVHDFQRILYELGAGSRVRLGIVRAGKRIELQATIERRPAGTLTH